MSLHDVAPPFVDTIREQLDILDGIGVGKVVLHVVPRWHGRDPLDGCPELIDLLRCRVGSGCEVSLHGLTHQVYGSLRGPALSRLRGYLFAAGNAEFLTLTGTQARAALAEGIAMIDRAGLGCPTTFCAPGWLISSGAEKACAESDFRILARMFSARDLKSGAVRRIPSFGHMGTPYEPGVHALNAITIATRVPRASIAAAYFHPQHFSPGAIESLRARLARMVDNGWTPITYADLVDV